MADHDRPPDDPPASGPPSDAGQPSGGGADRVVTAVLLVALTVLAVLAVPLGWLLGMTVAACGGPEYPPCNYGLITAGMWTAALGPLGAAIASAAFVAWRWRRPGLLFWVPLVGAALAVAVFALGAWLTRLGTFP